MGKYEQEIIKKHIDEALNRNYAIPSLGSVGTILKYQKKREKYRDNPTRCKHCDKSLLYNRRNYTYCGQDCYDLYIEEKKMKEPDLTLTSVKLIPELYDKFKVEKISNNNSLTLQQLVNRSIELYLSDSKYRKRLDKYNELQISGSGF